MVPEGIITVTQHPRRAILRWDAIHEYNKRCRYSPSCVPFWPLGTMPHLSLSFIMTHACPYPLLRHDVLITLCSACVNVYKFIVILSNMHSWSKSMANSSEDTCNFDFVGSIEPCLFLFCLTYTINGFVPKKCILLSKYLEYLYTSNIIIFTSLPSISAIKFRLFIAQLFTKLA